MPYVMVPVPEEFVTEAMDAILRIVINAEIKPWDADSIARYFEECDPQARELLITIARGGGSVPGVIEDTDLAARLGLSMREVLGLIREMNDDATTTRKRQLLIVVRQETVPTPEGKTREQRTLNVSHDIINHVFATYGKDPAA